MDANQHWRPPSEEEARRKADWRFSEEEQRGNWKHWNGEGYNSPWWIAGCEWVWTVVEAYGSRLAVEEKSFDQTFRLRMSDQIALQAGVLWDEKLCTCEHYRRSPLAEAREEFIRFTLRVLTERLAAFDGDFSSLLKGRGMLPHNRDDDQRTRRFYARFPDVELALRKSKLENERHALLCNFPELADAFFRRSHPQARKLLNIDRRLDIINSELASRQGVLATSAQPHPRGASAVSQPASHPEETEPAPQESTQDRAARRQAVVMPILKRKGWTRGRLAEKAGVAKHSIYDYLDGRRATITDENRDAIAGELGIKPDELPK